MKSFSRCGSWMVVCLLFAGLAGCGHTPATRTDRATVTGTVVYADKPLTGGRISFASVNNPNQQATGLLRPDGTYRIADVPLGEVTVSLDTECIRLGDAGNYVPIPERYRDPRTSGLRYTVKADESNEYAIVLQYGGA